jgi:hypothetical protein
MILEGVILALSATKNLSDRLLLDPTLPQMFPKQISWF